MLNTRYERMSRKIENDIEEFLKPENRGQIRQELQDMKNKEHKKRR